MFCLIFFHRNDSLFQPQRLVFYNERPKRFKEEPKREAQGEATRRFVEGELSDLESRVGQDGGLHGRKFAQRLPTDEELEREPTDVVIHPEYKPEKPQPSAGPAPAPETPESKERLKRHALRPEQLPELVSELRHIASREYFSKIAGVRVSEPDEINKYEPSFNNAVQRMPVEYAALAIANNWSHETLVAEFTFQAQQFYRRGTGWNAGDFGRWFEAQKHTFRHRNPDGTIIALPGPNPHIAERPDQLILPIDMDTLITATDSIRAEVWNQRFAELDDDEYDETQKEFIETWILPKLGVILIAQYVVANGVDQKTGKHIIPKKEERTWRLGWPPRKKTVSDYPKEWQQDFLVKRFLQEYTFRLSQLVESCLRSEDELERIREERDADLDDSPLLQAAQKAIDAYRKYKNIKEKAGDLLDNLKFWD